jgi:secondary thiamine-phosphate synthase enzyme
MKQYTNKIEILSSGIKIQNITKLVEKKVHQSKIKNGLLNLSILNTTASIVVQENADPDVMKDIEVFFKNLVPMNGNYNHSIEGQDDMPAHIKSVLTNSNITLSVIDGVIQLGIWQGIYLFEHREVKKKRIIFLHIMGN